MTKVLDPANSHLVQKWQQTQMMLEQEAKSIQGILENLKFIHD